MGFGVWGLGFGVWGLGFGVWGLGFGVYPKPLCQDVYIEMTDVQVPKIVQISASQYTMRPPGCSVLGFRSVKV